MKIVAWNCSGAFRNKYHKLDKYDADIFVISEAEKPEKYANNPQYAEYIDLFSNHHWIGTYNEKGILDENYGVLISAKKDIKIVDNSWNSEHKLFLSVNIDNLFDLIGVWTKDNYKTLKSKYVEEIIPYIKEYRNNIEDSDNIIFCGDFNSNKIWDKYHKGRCHTDLVNLFDSLNIKSVYHELNNEAQGEEKIATLYETYDYNQPYHIDYVFSTPDIVKNLEIGTYEEYVKKENRVSDHVPLIFEVDL